MRAAGVPLTERLLPAAPLRWLVIAGWSTLPLVRLAAFAALGAAAGLAADPMTLVSGRVSAVILNVYVVAIALVGTGIVSAKLDELRQLGGEDVERVIRLNGSVVWPTLLAVVLVLLNLTSTVAEVGVEGISTAPLAFAVDLPLSFLVRLPQATAFYTSVVCLLAVAELGRQPLPGRFPEDRSLGLSAVGDLLTTILGFYVAILIPVLLFGVTGDAVAIEFGLVMVLFGLGLSAMLLAVWRLHQRMAAERSRQVGAARERFAAAYRRATEDADAESGWALQRERLLLDGAESIHQWPFDDRTQRVLAVVLTGVVTGIVLRVAALFLGV